jgi:hypothetical protein
VLAGDPRLAGVAGRDGVRDGRQRAGGDVLGTGGQRRARQGVDHPVEVVPQRDEDGPDGQRVGGEDRGPQRRVARGDARHVPQPLPGQAEGRLVELPQARGDQARGQLRQVRHRRHSGVVLGRLHAHRHRAEVDGERADRQQRVRVRRAGVGDDPRPPEEEVRHRGRGPGPLAPRHRVGADVPAEVDAGGAQLLEHVALDRGDVGDHRVRMGHELGAHHVGRHVRRRGDDDERGLGVVGPRRRPGADVAGEGQRGA